MANDDSHIIRQTGKIVAGGVALATLILANRVTALHPIFGLPLFLYLIRDFKRASSLSDRLIVSMGMSFVILLFACYPIDFLLDKFELAKRWDIVLAILWFFIFPWVWAIRAESEIEKSRGGT